MCELYRGAAAAAAVIVVLTAGTAGALDRPANTMTSNRAQAAPAASPRAAADAPQPRDVTGTGELARVTPQRPYDGIGNNEDNPGWGSVDEQLVRAAPAAYADGISTPAGATRLPPRVISNGCAPQGRDPMWSDRALTTMTVFWGQFIDHDIDLTEPPAAGAEPMMIMVPLDDPYFDPGVTPMLPFLRSRYDASTGTDAGNPRQQVNQITAFIDGSVVYGETEARADALRSFTGGKLLEGPGGLLPKNTVGIGMANPFGLPDAALFAGGDIRANENAALTVLHTVFLREHNRLCDELALANPAWTDEELYQGARLYVGSLIQAITYNEFLPALLGHDAVPAYEGYDNTVNPGIANGFAHGAYRVGHTMVNPLLPRYDADWNVFADGHLDLFGAFFNNSSLEEPGGVDALVRGMIRQASQEVDPLIVDDLRNLLFPAGSGGMDLASVNIQRGRDHGLADYNTYRAAYGLAPITEWGDVISDATTRAALESVYPDVNDADMWVAGLAEDHAPGSSLGGLLTAIIADQFTRMRDGDRFWYELVHTPAEVDELNATRLSDVIARNTGVTGIQQSVFHLNVDYDEDANVDIDDISAFIDLYLSNSPRADLNGDLLITVDDINIFVDAFIAAF